MLPAVTVVPLLPGPALRDGFSHVLGLRIVVPEALRRLSGQLLRQRQSLVDLSILAPISRSLSCVGSMQREGALRSSHSTVLTAFVRVCFQAVVDHIPSTHQPWGLGEKTLELRAGS